MALEIVRWGLIGAGAVCEAKSGPAFSRVPGSALVAACRRDPERLADFARRHGVPRTHATALALVRDPEVDAVYVATPPDTHAELTELAAAHGKHVYVEKPMARTHAECARMIDACARAGVRLFVAYYRRRHPRFERARALLAGGAIGAPRLARVTLTRPAPADPASLGWRDDPRVGGGGKVVDLGCHVLDLLEHLLGPVVEAAGVATRVLPARPGVPPAEDHASFSLRFASGAVGAGLLSFAAERAEDELAIVGDRGALRVPVFAAGALELEAGGERRRFDEPSPSPVQEPLIRAIVDELRGVAPPGTCPSTGETGARATLHLDRILASHRAGSW